MKLQQKAWEPAMADRPHPFADISPALIDIPKKVRKVPEENGNSGKEDRS
jgi:hypothetical protein